MDILLKKIVSGGQTGVDRAALDAALTFNLPIGGWCPKDRLAEDGAIAKKYPLQETPESDYITRTKLNVKDSDATLIISKAPLTGGTLLTADYAQAIEKPYYVLNWHDVTDDNIAKVMAWLATNQVQVLNLAGPRASGGEQAYDRAYDIIIGLLESILQRKNYVKTIK